MHFIKLFVPLVFLFYLCRTWPFVVYRNAVAGAITGIRNDENQLSYTTLEIDIFQNTRRFEGNAYIPYNPNYKAARRLFGNSIIGYGLRAAGFSAGHVLFTRMLGSVSDTMTTGYYFDMTMNYGMRKGRRRLYNFVLSVGHYLRIAEVGRSFLRDQHSKHAVLSQGSEEVFTAGELFYRNGFWILSNASGTYAPPLETVENLAETMREGLPGIRIRVMDYQDPIYNVYRDELDLQS